MSWLSRALHYLTNAISSIWRQVSPKVKADFERFVSEFADVALEAINEQAVSVLSGQQKLGNAADVVLKAAEAAGWKILKTAAITLVQDVYTATKATGGPLVAPPGDPIAAADIEARLPNPAPNI
jgi:hypothetical protein